MGSFYDPNIDEKKIFRVSERTSEWVRKREKENLDIKMKKTLEC